MDSIKKEQIKNKNNIMKKLTVLTVAIFILSTSILYSQNIKRRGFFGVKTVELNDSIANANNLKVSEGILITDITQGATFSTIGIMKSDVIISVNNIPVKKIGEYKTVLSKIRQDEIINIRIQRGSEILELSGKVIPLAYETSDKYDVIYDEVKYKEGYIRVIINKPKGTGKFKSIFFIPGYMCYSLDNIGKHPYAQLVQGLCEKGYAVMRAEKLGMGDCINTPDCNDVGYFEELDAFEVAYYKFLGYDFVDKSNVFIFGHSLGGYEAPMLAAKTQPKGVIVCGTGIITWFEYIIEMFRFQNIIQGADYVENEIFIQKIIPLLYDYLIVKKKPSELSKDSVYNSLLKEYLEFDGKDKIWSRNYKFWQDIQDLNLPEYWKSVKSNVLIVRGEGDYEAFSTLEHQEIENIVNKYNPGKGKFILVPNMDHAFAKSKSPSESHANSKIKGFYYDNFNPVIFDVVSDWINNIK
jgi:pimeloyl-ACP methyl ester carboxylesterase